MSAPIYEHHLAKELGVSKDTLRELRASVLTPDDWREVQGRGIELTADGQKKIRAALATPPEPLLEAVRPPADFVLTRTSFPNPLIVEGRRVDADDATVEKIIICQRQPVLPLRGWYLRGCVWSQQRAMYEFHGRATRR